MTERLRVGTRGSPLARAQTELVVRALHRVAPEVVVEPVLLRTSGDRVRRARSTLDFTDDIDRCLEEGDVDLAVHSAKDLPARPVRRVEVAAYPRRGDPRDCLVLRTPGTLADLPRGARLGSSSVRRRAQLLRVRPDLEVLPVRGNVGTRIEKIRLEGLDGVVLAAAGLLRLGWKDRISEHLGPPRWLPAPGQGALAVEVRKGDRLARRTVERIDHRPTRAEVEAERAVVSSLGGDCNLPLGALGRVRSGRLLLRAALFSPDGRRRLSFALHGSPSRAERLGAEVGHRLAEVGDAAGLLPERRGRP